MGVQYMQSEGIYSQLLQVGNLLHIGQHEAGHNWKHGGGGDGYFKTLLAGEAHDAEEAMSSSISNYIHVHTAEDTKPLILRSLEISSAAHLHLPPTAVHGHVHKSPPPIHAHTIISAATNSSPSHLTTSPHPAKTIIPSPLCLEPKPSSPCITSSSLKRARDPFQIEGISKREKKGSEEGMKEKGKKGVQAAAATAAVAVAVAATAFGGRKTGGAKTKTSKPAPTEPPKTDYVHVRARRGQATDSHSLAERVRREKISERMRFLQDLVPSCSKITGKALILDEIINYVQSLQNQVEFLAMRLAAINPKLEYASLSNSTEEEIASPFVEEVRDCIDILPKDMATHTPTSDLHFDSLSAFYPGLFDDSNFNASIVSDLSTSTCNDSNLTNMASLI